MTRAILVAATLCGSAFGWFLTAAHPLAADPPHAAVDAAPRITSNAVWNPTSNELSSIRKKCTEGAPPQHETCFVDAMKSAGASAEATAFVKAFADHGLAYVRAFRDTGRVDIAYIEYLFRANDLDGVLLVNGTPPFVDVDDDKFTSKEEYSETVKRKYPDATIWPADRYHTNLPTEQSSDAGQTFEVEYLLLKGCHACERLGTVVIAFDFDSSGRFLKTQIAKVVTEAKTSSVVWPEQGRDTDDYVTPMQIRSKVGDSFTIPLEANHTTGYSWRLAQPPDPATLKQLSENYVEDSSGKMGSGGKELWTFQATGKGTTLLIFEYTRPFEKDAVPANTAKYQIEIK